mmetsp:Transcript_51782/g.75780  ORF Transcript_51782/g.75780 Transcript_51782/m.75780 type:complete len:232 (+) Transcript_51782:21-716(+)
MQPPPSPSRPKKQKQSESKGTGTKKTPPKKHKPNVTICCPFVYGSIAFWLGRKAQETQTHRWTLYVRGASNEDLSYLLSKVVFTLHSSFQDQIREVTAPPFQVTEVGWGEFEARIALHFRDPGQRPVELAHFLRLYPDGQPPNAKRPVVSEVYDEVVFTDPAPAFQEALLQSAHAPPLPALHQEFLPIYNDAEDIQKLSAARDFLKAEINAAKNAIIRVEEDISRLSQQLH